jgi:hypothetical protein
MNDLVDKLVADVRWRLKRGGREFRPSLKEREAWGAFRFPPFASCLLWIGNFIFSCFAADQIGDDTGILFWLCSNTITTLTFTVGVDYFNKFMIERSYRNLLQTNERFTLVEYAKYIKRQIKRARLDPALGGAAEVQRLQAVYNKLNVLLQKGAGNELFSVESHLSKEADLAEAVVETYNITEQDDLAALDSQLPTNIRERLAELELEVEPLPVAKRSSEKG